MNTGLLTAAADEEVHVAVGSAWTVPDGQMAVSKPLRSQKRCRRMIVSRRIRG